jgi:hypothetical protein
MKRSVLVALVAGAVASAVLPGAAIDVIPEIKTVAERVAETDAVLRVRAVSEPTVRAEDLAPGLRESDPDASIPGPLLMPLIEQDVEVLEVIKGDAYAVLGARLRLGTSGGDDGVYLASDWRQRRALAVGATYVLFLWEHARAKQLRYSWFDMFRLDRVRVIGPDETPYGKALLTMTSSDALALIRDAVQNGR